MAYIFECLGSADEYLRNWSLERDKSCLTSSEDITNKMKSVGDIRCKLLTFIEQLHMN